MTPQAILFDCDGVIVDSESMTFALLAEDFARFGLRLTVDDIARDFIGGTMAGVAERARAAGADLPADWVDQFYLKLYEHLAQGTPLVAGILQVLDRLEAASIPFAIGSNGSLEKMQITLGQHAGLIARFQGHLYSGQAMAAPKPAPDLYLHAARALGVDPAQCVVVEDSPTGARAARNAGMRCLGYAPHGDSRLAEEGAEIFSDMKQLPALIGL